MQKNKLRAKNILYLRICTFYKHIYSIKIKYSNRILYYKQI